MTKITATNLLEMLRQDYENNFMPRKEIDLQLSFDQLKELLQEKTLQMDTQVHWHFKFYLKQLFVLSWENINQANISFKQKLEMIKELHEVVKFDHSNEVRALVALIRITFFLPTLSKFDLYEMFSGTSIYDDHCAQVAYVEYIRRTKEKYELSGIAGDNYK